MRFLALEIKGVRNLLSTTRVEPCGGINILAGPNAGGKTAFLEAINLLSCSRSFRTHQVRQVIQHGGDGFLIIAKLADPGPVTIGLQRNCAGTSFHYDGDEIRTSSEQRRKVPVVLVTPDSYLLITGTPRDRRRWMDHGVFHVKPSYLEDWKRYILALRSRNALLRRPDSLDPELSVWEEEMEKSAVSLTESRMEFMKHLSGNLEDVCTRLKLDGDIELELVPGWDFDKGLAEVLRKKRNHDRRQGYTTSGPHCADVLFSLERRPVREFFSRGQQKKLFLALAAALSLCLPEKKGQGKPVIIVDDLPAELDKRNLADFLTLLSESGNQAFITCTDPAPLSDALPAPAEKAWFHVKQGRISRVTYTAMTYMMR